MVRYSLCLYFRQMLFCRVTLGKSFLQFSAMKMAHAPPGHHSVIGRPSVNGLAYAEYVIYRGEQVCFDVSLPQPLFLIKKNVLWLHVNDQCSSSHLLDVHMSSFLSKKTWPQIKCVLCPQAYPEYLITYQIVKPESLATPAAPSEQKS